MPFFDQKTSEKNDLLYEDTRGRNWKNGDDLDYLETLDQKPSDGCPDFPNCFLYNSCTALSGYFRCCRLVENSQFLAVGIVKKDKKNTEKPWFFGVLVFWWR